MEKIYYANTNQWDTEVFILIPDKGDFRVKSITRDIKQIRYEVI